MGGGIFYAYRGKGGKTGRKELPRPAFKAIQKVLAAFGKDLSSMEPEESLWPSHGNTRQGVTSGTDYDNLRRDVKQAGLPSADVHVLRHSSLLCVGGVILLV